MIKMYSGIMITAIIAMFQTQLVKSQNHYSSYQQMSQKIDEFGRQYRDLCTVKSLVKTGEARDIWLITVGSGPKDDKPGIAIVGGVEGNYLLGRELALGFAERS